MVDIPKNLVPNFPIFLRILRIQLLTSRDFCRIRKFTTSPMPTVRLHMVLAFDANPIRPSFIKAIVGGDVLRRPPRPKPSVAASLEDHSMILDCAGISKFRITAPPPHPTF